MRNFDCSSADSSSTSHVFHLLPIYRNRAGKQAPWMKGPGASLLKSALYTDSRKCNIICCLEQLANVKDTTGRSLLPENLRARKEDLLIALQEELQHARRKCDKI
eukprot:IDg11690t1